jgi:hypothetical protein
VDTGVIDRPDKSRFELPVEDEVAVAYYHLDGNRITLTHTEVPQHLSGQGIGSRLAKGVFRGGSGERAQGGGQMPVHGRLCRPPSRIRRVARRLNLADLGTDMMFPSAPVPPVMPII